MHAHAHAHMLGRDVDLDVGTGWIIGLSTFAAIAVVAGLLLLIRDGGGTGSTQVTPAIATSTADGMQPTGAAIVAARTLAEQQRATTLEIDRMLDRVTESEATALAAER